MQFRSISCNGKALRSALSISQNLCCAKSLREGASQSLAVVQNPEGILYNVWCYTKEAIISTKVDAEYKCLFNHKCFCGVPNRLFCIARVITSAFTDFKLLTIKYKKNVKRIKTKNKTSFKKTTRVY